MIILEEGNISHPQGPRCEMLLPCKALNDRHTNTTQCEKGVERKRCHLVAEDIRESAVSSFQAYGKPIDMVTYLKYMGWVLTASYDDWTADVGNLQKARKI